MFPALYAILDASPEFASDSSLSILEIADCLLEAGVELFQYRDKQGSPRQIQEISQALVALLAATGEHAGARSEQRATKSGQLGAEGGQLGTRQSHFIVNDRADIAAIIGAGGVLVGQEDLPVEEARKFFGGWVGISTHNLQQVRAASETSADYIAVGPIFPTGTKANPDPVVGLELLRAARQITRKPLVAIGGITVESASAVYQAGADSIAVIRDLMTAKDPGKKAREYLEIRHLSAGRI